MTFYKNIKSFFAYTYIKKINLLNSLLIFKNQKVIR
jgi:hypothetical protein